MSTAASAEKAIAKCTINEDCSTSRENLEPSLSIYLDILRITAALLVFAYHAKAKRLNGEWLSPIGNFGHDAVIIFFVLSGFVIAYTADKAAAQNSNINSFIKSRLARLTSVAIPALVFTVMADTLGQHFNPELYVEPYYIDSSPILRFMSNLLFLNEVWFSSWRAFSNGPFWSLSYEFFYYLLFSAAFFLRGVKRVAMCCGAALIAGPKILLLMPTWLLGVLSYRASRNLNITPAIGLLLVLNSIFIYMLYRVAEFPADLFTFTQALFGADIVQQLKFSQWFLNDYFVAALVSTHLLGIATIAPMLLKGKKFGVSIRTLAGTTFTLYLFHYPLLLLYSSVFSNSILVVLLTLISVALISLITEGRKQQWLTLINQIASLKTKPFQRGIKLE